MALILFLHFGSTGSVSISTIRSGRCGAMGNWREISYKQMFLFLVYRKRKSTCTQIHQVSSTTAYRQAALKLPGVMEKKSSTGVKGVTWHKRDRVFEARKSLGRIAHPTKPGKKLEKSKRFYANPSRYGGDKDNALGVLRLRHSDCENYDRVMKLKMNHNSLGIFEDPFLKQDIELKSFPALILHLHTHTPSEIFRQK